MCPFCFSAAFGNRCNAGVFPTSVEELNRLLSDPIAAGRRAHVRRVSLAKSESSSALEACAVAPAKSCLTLAAILEWLL
jgi:hypothetical protein